MRKWILAAGLLVIAGSVRESLAVPNDALEPPARVGEETARVEITRLDAAAPSAIRPPGGSSFRAPEPATAALLLGGLGGLAWSGRRRR